MHGRGIRRPNVDQVDFGFVILIESTVLAHVNGFYLNQSIHAGLFNPEWSITDAHSASSHLLLELLARHSSSFHRNLLSNFRMSQDEQLNMDLSMLRHHQWSSFEEENEEGTHVDTLSEIESRGITRDWNGEYQSAKEMPRSTELEQVIRSRVLFKITSEFHQMASKGAMEILAGNVPPMNPLDVLRCHVYVINATIFFSRITNNTWT